MTPHDPIAVINPEHYGGRKDSEIPIVLAYDLVHYESLHTVDCHDIEETKKLALSYISEPSTYLQDYGFTRQDMKYLISSSKAQELMEGCRGQMRNVSPDKNLKREVSAGFVFEGISFKQTSTGKTVCGVCQVECRSPNCSYEWK